MRFSIFLSHQHLLAVLDVDAFGKSVFAHGTASKVVDDIIQMLATRLCVGCHLMDGSRIDAEYSAEHFIGIFDIDGV